MSERPDEINGSTAEPGRDRQLEATYRRIVQDMREAFALCASLPGNDAGKAPDLRLLQVNRAFAAMFDAPSAAPASTATLAADEDAMAAVAEAQRRLSGGEELVRFEYRLPTRGRWIRIQAFRVDSGAETFSVLLEDVAERKEGEEALAMARRRQSYLLELDAAIRNLSDPGEVQAEVVRLLGEHLATDRTVYMEHQGDQLVIRRDWARHPRSTSDADPAEIWQGALDAAFHGDEGLTVHDARSDHRLTEADRDAYRRAGISASIAVPIVRKGEVVALLGVHSVQPRRWTEEEIEIVRTTAERAREAVERASAETSLRESEERYRFLVESAREYAIFMLDVEGRITSWNAGAAQVFGFEEDEVVGLPGAIIFTEGDRAAGIPEAELRTASSEGRALDERWHIRKDGSHFWASGVLEAMVTAGGTLRGFAKVLRDNTRRRETELELARERGRLETVLEVLPVGLAIADEKGGIIRDNAATRELWGVPLSSAVDSWEDYEAFVAWWPGSGERIRAHEWAMTRAVLQGETTRDELVLIQRLDDEGQRYYLNNVVPIRDLDGRISGAVAAMVDVTDQVVAERALREVRDELEERVEERTRQVRDLAALLSQAEQQERARIAQVLHDSVQQHLHAVQAKHGNVILDLQSYDQVPDALVQELRTAQEWMREAIEVTRSLGVDLNPPVLRQEGLGHALTWLASQMQSLHDLDVTVATRHDGTRLAWEVRLVAYQMVRELLFNVVKHANTSRAWVSIYDEEEHVLVEVADAGGGFDAEELGESSARSGSGLGLTSVRERLLQLGGELQVDSRLGKGTTITLRIPTALRPA